MKTVEKTQKIPLEEYYHSLPKSKIIAPKKSLIDAVAKGCDVELSTAYGYLKSGVPSIHLDTVDKIMRQHEKKYRAL